MKQFKVIYRSLTLVLIALCFAGCNEKNRARLSDFKVLKTFSAKDQSGQTVTLKPNQSGDYGWEVVFGSASNGQSGLMLVNDELGLAIPFAAGEGFEFGSNSYSSASATGQGIAVQQRTLRYRDGSEAARSVIEDCKDSRSERICEAKPGQAEQCYDRTVTSTGQRNVVVSKHGSLYEIEIRLIDSKKRTLATMNYEQDLTYESRQEGRCF